MLAFSNAACGAGTRIPRSKMRLSASPPQREITAKSSSIQGSRFRRACSQKYQECRGGRIRRRSRADLRNRCGKGAERGPSGIVGHHLLLLAPMFRYYLLSRLEPCAGDRAWRVLRARTLLHGSVVRRRGLDGISGPRFSPWAAPRAIQSEPRSPSSLPEAAAQSDELGCL